MAATIPEGKRTTGPGADQDARRPLVFERRRRVIDAFIDLVLEGHVPPEPAEVARRAQISMATLYRYFEHHAEMRSEAMQRVLERFPGVASIPETGDGPRADRISRFVAARINLHETLHPLARLQRAAALTDPTAAAAVDSSRTALAEQVRRHFATELRELTRARRDDVVASIASLTSVESWEQFRRSHGRTPVQMRRAWVAAVDRLLPDP
jgi:AcrR family transcriptional regulator